MGNPMANCQAKEFDCRRFDFFPGLPDDSFFRKYAFPFSSLLPTGFHFVFTPG
jgi:hypothetical protein